MKYLQRSFTFVGATSDTYAHAHAVCNDTGHMDTDVRGKCMRCGEKPTAGDSTREQRNAAYLRGLFRPSDYVAAIDDGHDRLETDGSHDTTRRGRTPADVTTP